MSPKQSYSVKGVIETVLSVTGVTETVLETTSFLFFSQTASRQGQTNTDRCIDFIKLHVCEKAMLN